MSKDSEELSGHNEAEPLAEDVTPVDWAEEQRVYDKLTQQGLRKRPRSFKQTLREWWAAT